MPPCCPWWIWLFLMIGFDSERIWMPASALPEKTSQTSDSLPPHSAQSPVQSHQSPLSLPPLPPLPPLTMNAVPFQEAPPSSEEVHAPLLTITNLIVFQSWIALPCHPHTSIGVAIDTVLDKLSITLQTHRGREDGSVRMHIRTYVRTDGN